MQPGELVLSPSAIEAYSDIAEARSVDVALGVYGVEMASCSTRSIAHGRLRAEPPAARHPA